MYKFKLMPVLLLALFLGACSNDEGVETANEAEEVDVTFNVSTLTVQNEDMDNPPLSRRATRAASSGADLKDVIHSIWINIYDGSGKFVTTLETRLNPMDETTSEDFGTFKTRLKTGTYSVRVLAEGKGTGQAYFNNSEKYMESGEGKDNGKICNSGDIETFFYAGNITISKDVNEIDLNLKRQSALLQIKIMDGKPDEVGKVTYTFKDKRDHYSVYAHYITNQIETMVITPEFVNNKLVDYEYYFPMVDSQGESKKITFTIYDTSNKVLVERDVNIMIYPNKRTIISGDLFSILNEKSLTISVDDIWESDVNVNL